MVFARLLMFLTPLWMLASPLAAHEGRPVFIEVTQQSENIFQLRWKIPPVVEPGAEPLIRLSGADCTLAAGAPRAALMGTQHYSCSGDRSGLQVDLRYPGLNPVLSTLILYKALDGMEQSIMASPDETRVAMPVAETFWGVAKRYTLAGIDHIKSGYDHLLFVLCLMLLAGSLRRVLITVTGFTLGHSLTLGLSALGSWSLSPTFVEPLIAFSIVILAAEIARGNKGTLSYKYPALVATGFGLLHGFGFGGALAEIGLPYGLKLQALGFFNLGVEIGQIGFVIAVFAVVAMLRQMAVAIKFAIPGGKIQTFAIYPVGMVAAFWTLERVVSIWQ